MIDYSNYQNLDWGRRCILGKGGYQCSCRRSCKTINLFKSFLKHNLLIHIKQLESSIYSNASSPSLVCNSVLKQDYWKLIRSKIHKKKHKPCSILERIDKETAQILLHTDPTKYAPKF